MITLDQLESPRFAKSWSFSMRDLLTANGGKWGSSVKEKFFRNYPLLTNYSSGTFLQKLFSRNYASETSLQELRSSNYKSLVRKPLLSNYSWSDRMVRSILCWPVMQARFQSISMSYSECLRMCSITKCLFARLTWVEICGSLCDMRWKNTSMHSDRKDCQFHRVRFDMVWLGLAWFGKRCWIMIINNINILKNLNISLGFPRAFEVWKTDNSWMHMLQTNGYSMLQPWFATFFDCLSFVRCWTCLTYSICHPLPISKHPKAPYLDCSGSKNCKWVRVRPSWNRATVDVSSLQSDSITETRTWYYNVVIPCNTCMLYVWL